MPAPLMQQAQTCEHQREATWNQNAGCADEETKINAKATRPTDAGGKVNPQT